MRSVTEKQRRFRPSTAIAERLMEDFARKLDRDARRPPRTRAPRVTAATLLMRRLRFGSEWL